MTTYTWKIQFSENYPDEFKQKGTIDKENAIQEFQLFPWDKEIDDYKRRDDNPTVPKIIFNSDDNRQLILSSTSNKGYEAEYTNLASNKFSKFYISNNFEEDSFAPEEIIDFFFNDTLEQHVKLKDIPKQNEKKAIVKKPARNIEFTFKPSLQALFSINFFVWLVLSVLCVSTSVNGSTIPKWSLFLFAMTWPIPIIVHLSYYFKNSGATVVIDTQNHDLVYSKGSTQIKFNRDDIFRCQVTRSKRTRMSMCDEYSYVWFILHDRTYVIITHFITDPNEIVETLNCKFETRDSGPFLPIL